MSPEPTARQREVLTRIDEHRKTHGHAPTLNELGEALGISSLYAVSCHLQALRTKGFVEWTPKLARTLSITSAGRRFLPARAA